MERYLGSLSEEERRGVGVVCVDLYDPYRNAVRAMLPDADIVADPFHVVRGAGQALDSVRRTRQRQLRTKEQGRKTLRATWNRASTGPGTCSCAPKSGSPSPSAAAFASSLPRPRDRRSLGLKELLRSVYAAEGRAEAAQRLDRFFAAVTRSSLQSFEAYVNGIESWREEILAYVDQPASNGYAEGVINKVKVIKRRAYGLPSFEGFRERVLVACG